jgi:hypothetical protein
MHRAPRDHSRGAFVFLPSEADPRYRDRRASPGTLSRSIRWSRTGSSLGRTSRASISRRSPARESAHGSRTRSPGGARAPPADVARLVSGDACVAAGLALLAALAARRPCGGLARAGRSVGDPGGGWEEEKRRDEQELEESGAHEQFAGKLRGREAAGGNGLRCMCVKDGGAALTLAIVMGPVCCHC